MKNLIYSFGIILLFIIITACQKNNELAEELENPALNPLESTLRICHIDEDGYATFTIVYNNGYTVNAVSGFSCGVGISGTATVSNGSGT